MGGAVDDRWPRRVADELTVVLAQTPQSLAEDDRSHAPSAGHPHSAPPSSAEKPRSLLMAPRGADAGLVGNGLLVADEPRQLVQADQEKPVGQNGHTN